MQFGCLMAPFWYHVGFLWLSFGSRRLPFRSILNRVGSLLAICWLPFGTILRDFVHPDASMEYQEASREYHKAFMEFQEGFMEYKKLSWNTQDFPWNTKRLPWITRIHPEASMEYQEAFMAK